VETFPTCPVTEFARLGRTLRPWKTAFLGYFDTGRASNGGTEAIDGLIELHRRIARGFTNRDNYRRSIGDGAEHEVADVHGHAHGGCWAGFGDPLKQPTGQAVDWPPGGRRLTTVRGLPHDADPPAPGRAATSPNRAARTGAPTSRGP